MTLCEDVIVKSNYHEQDLKEKSITGSLEDVRNVNISHKEVLEQLRRNLSCVLDPSVSDKELLKLLRARNFNIRECEELIRVNIAVKQVFKLEEVDEYWDVPKVVENYEFANHLGIAKDGTPVYYIDMGHGDLTGFVHSLDLYDLSRYLAGEIVKLLKLCREQSRRLGKEISEVTFIIDMEGFSISQLFFHGVVELGLDLFKILQELYPEIWNNILVINAPFYFQTVFNIFKPIFGRYLLRDIYVASKDRTPQLLLKFIDADVLPAFLGGNRVDSFGDPMCSKFMKFDAGIVPESYYLRNLPPLVPIDPGVMDVWVPARGCHNASVVVQEENSIIRVEMRTEGGSIIGGILYRKLGLEPENPDLPSSDEYLDASDEKCNVTQISYFLHYQLHVAPINSYCFAPWPGIYIFKFDNSHSWIHQKRCIYRLRVLPPSAE